MEKPESSDRAILFEFKKKMEEAKGLWLKQLNVVLWSYYMTLHSYGVQLICNTCGNIYAYMEM